MYGVNFGAKSFNKDPRWLTRAEKNLLIRILNDPQALEKNRWKACRNKAIVYLQLMAGLRVSEVVASDIRDPDFDSGCVFVRAGKGSKARVIPMNKDLRQALQDWIAVRGSW